MATNSKTIFKWRFTWQLRRQRTGQTMPFLAKIKSSYNFSSAAAGVVFPSGHAERSTYKMKISKLKIQWQNRQGGGGGKTKRRYLDFIIDGKPLLDHLNSSSADFIGRLGWVPIAEHNAGIEHLLLKRPPDSPSKRVLILICPECGDIGCGAFSVLIKKDKDHFIWQEFVFENDYEDGPVELFDGIGPFYFNKHEYFAELDKHRMNK